MLIEFKFDNKNSNSSIPFLPIALVAKKFFSTLILSPLVPDKSIKGSNC